MQTLFLIIAIVLEAFGSTMLKISDGFSKLTPTLFCIGAYVVSFYLFSLSIRTISLGFAYAIWAGMGIVFTAVISVTYFKESMDWAAILGIALIISGVLVMNLFSKTAGG